MTFVEAFLAAAASLCGLSAGTFCVLYARTRRGKRRLWWETETGRNLMALAGSLAILASGTVVQRLIPAHDAGNIILTAAYLLVAAVMVWRTVMMWRANHPHDHNP